MPTPLSPSSSQEIIPIYPPLPSSSSASSSKRRRIDPTATTLPKPKTFTPKGELRDAVLLHISEQEQREVRQGMKRGTRVQGFSAEAGAKEEERNRGGIEVGSERNGVRISPRVKKKMKVNEEQGKEGELSRGQATRQMMSTLGQDGNPITNSDLYSRTDHFVSTATGHQQSNRGGGSFGAATYWAVRLAKMEDQARDKKSDLFRGCVFYLNGSTGPRVSNLQAQHMITANGGRFLAMHNASCTHIIASGGLSGSKTQKWIDGQAGRGASKRMKVVRIDWLLDCVEQGRRINEADYAVIQDPSQKNLRNMFAPKSGPSQQG